MGKQIKKPWLRTFGSGGPTPKVPVAPQIELDPRGIEVDKIYQKRMPTSARNGDMSKYYYDQDLQHAAAQMAVDYKYKPAAEKAKEWGKAALWSFGPEVVGAVAPKVIKGLLEDRQLSKLLKTPKYEPPLHTPKAEADALKLYHDTKLVKTSKDFVKEYGRFPTGEELSIYRDVNNIDDLEISYQQHPHFDLSFVNRNDIPTRDAYTPKEQATTLAYTGSGYNFINTAARKELKNVPYIENEVIPTLEETIKKTKLKNDEIFSRGDNNHLVPHVWRTDENGVKQYIQNKIAYIELQPGDVWMPDKFTSTSLNKPRNNSFGAYKSSILAPKGQSVLYPNRMGIGYHQGEEEVLLPSKLKFQVVERNYPVDFSKQYPGGAPPDFVHKIINPYTISGLIGAGAVGAGLQNNEEDMQQYKEGGTIHIKKKNVGKFTTYKKRTGKTTAEALHSKDPHVRQMANFARNAKKWKHGDGGYVQTPEYGIGGTIGAASGVMAATPTPWTQIAGAGLSMIGGIVGGVEQKQAAEQAANLQQQQMGQQQARYSQSQIRNPYTATFPYGGMIPNAQPNIEAEGGEVIQGADGSTAEIQGPKHAQGGVPLAAAGGGRIFSDRIVNPETGNTFADDALALQKQLKKYKK
jgi:hypothetical protein